MKSNKNLGQKKNLVLLIAVFLVMVIIFFLILYISVNKISGKAVLESCTDSDNGLTYDVRGFVTDINGNHEDYCSDGKLLEAYCEKNKVLWSEYTCPGECSDGACIEKQAAEKSATPINPESCSDSDGFNYNKKGSVKYCDIYGKCIEREDNCETGKLNEYYCEDKKIAVERLYNCKYGCNNGACRETPVEMSVSGGSGGGGGSSSDAGNPAPAPQVINYQTYSLGDLIVSEIEALNNDKIKFNIINNSIITEYTLTITAVSSTGINALFENPSQTFSLSIGEEKYIDLDKDSSNDIIIKLKSVSMTTNKAKLLMTRV